MGMRRHPVANFRRAVNGIPVEDQDDLLAGCLADGAIEEVDQHRRANRSLTTRIGRWPVFEIPWITFAFEVLSGALDHRGRADRAPSLKDAVKQSVRGTVCVGPGGARRRKRRAVAPCS
jgi:hypothetical protein